VNAALPGAVRRRWRRGRDASRAPVRRIARHHGDDVDEQPRVDDDHDAIRPESDIDARPRDVQAAINAAAASCRRISRRSELAKVNPADAPVMILDGHVGHVRQGAQVRRGLLDLQQKLAHVEGVGQVSGRRAARLPAGPRRGPNRCS
jgi:hypothetical protein